MHYRRHMVLLAVFVVYAGCKKDAPQTPDKGTATTSVAAPSPSKPAPTPAPVGVEAKPDPRASATERTTPYERKLPPTNTQCMLACNKAQACGTAQGAVTACVGQCLKAMEAKEGDLADLAVAFRAQALCAQKPCADFKSCVAATLLGEKALATAPSLAPKKAVEVCKALCEQEQKCHPDEFKQRAGGMGSCRYACRSVLVNPEADMAPQRALMMQTHKCITEDCSAFSLCVRNSFSRK